MRCMKKYVKDNGDHKLSDQVKYLQNRLNSIIKVINKSITPVHQISWQIQWPVQNPNWSTFKTFWKSKKIPPLSHKNQYGTDFKERADLFNSFAEQCFFINNSSKLPSTFLKRKEKVLWPISFSSNDIPKITWHLHHNKARGHDMISIRMLRICGVPIWKLLEITFKSCIEKMLVFWWMEKSKYRSSL